MRNWKGTLQTEGKGRVQIRREWLSGPLIFFFYLMGSHVSSDDICFELKQCMLISVSKYCKGGRALKLSKTFLLPPGPQASPQHSGLPSLSEGVSLRHSETLFGS